MTGSDAFFFHLMKKQKNRCPWKPWHGHQHMVFVGIFPVYNGWVDETSSELCAYVDEFVDSLEKGLERTSGQAEARGQGS